MTEDRRPKFITALSIIQMVLAAVYLGGVVQLCYLATTAKADNPADVADEVRGMLIGAAFCGVFAFASVVAALGLWWRERWGWWLAVVSVALAVVGLAMGFYDDGHWDRDVLPWLIGFTAMLIVYLVPAARQGLKAKQIPSGDLNVSAP